MARYLLKRFLQAFVVVLLVTLITFTILHFLPGGAARAALGKEATQAQIEAYNEANGFNDPLPVQYVSYLGRLFTGQLGHSYQLNQDVGEAIAQRLPKTMILSVVAIIIAVVLSIPIGALQAVKRNKWQDYVGTILSLLAYSTPLFFLGLVFIILFSHKLGWFPPQAPQGYTVAEVLSDFKALVLPACTLAVVMMAAYARYVRSSMIDNLNENYIRTARAKGLPERRIVIGHALRNSLFPIITLLGMYLPALFSGALVVESLFNYPGMGLMFWRATQFRDYPVLLAVTVIVSLATVLGNLLADIFYAVADPRVRTGEKA